MKPTLDDLLHNSLIATDIPSEELNERILNQSTQKEVVPMRKKETKKPWKMAQTAAATLSVAVVMSDVNWVAVASSTLLAGILSMLTSVGGLPEVKESEE